MHVKPRFAVAVVEEMAGIEVGGVGVFFFDEVVGGGEELEVDGLGVYPFIEDTLIAGVVTAAAGVFAGDSLKLLDGAVALQAAVDGEDAGVDLAGVAFVSASGAKAGVRSGEEWGVVWLG